MTTVVADFCVALTWDMVYYRFNHNMAAVKQILLQWNEKHYYLQEEIWTQCLHWQYVDHKQYIYII